MRRVLLIGGGHAHALVLRHLERSPLHEAAVSIVAPSREQIYSGMVPGYLAGHYARDEITIDLARLAKAAGARFVSGAVTFLDPGRRVARLEDAQQLEYDIASLNVGSLTDESLPGAGHALPVKPLDRFLREVRTSRGTRTAIVGGGTAGAELAMALAFRGVSVSLYAERAIGAKLGAALRRNAVAVHENTPVSAIERGPAVRTGDGKSSFDQVLLSTGAAALPWLLSAGLPLDERGFALVEPTLQCVSHGELFAVGDCATLREAPHPKSGVYSVRHAEVLQANLAAAVRGEAGMRRYSPQRRTLMLVSCGGRRALAQWGALEAEGAWLWRVKDAIDRRWIAGFR